MCSLSGTLTLLFICLPTLSMGGGAGGEGWDRSQLVKGKNAPLSQHEVETAVPIFEMADVYQFTLGLRANVKSCSFWPWHKHLK